MRLTLKLAVIATGLMVTTGLIGPAAATARPGPVVYKTARALPARGGQFVRIIVYAKHVKVVAIRVDGAPGPRHRAKRFGRGCGDTNCTKWNIYVPRTGNECYKLGIIGSQGHGRLAIIHHTVCVPFRDGEV